MGKGPPYDVFLSFRGEDTRDNFVSHLYAALCRNKIETYIDYKLERGNAISPSLLKAIQESVISVIIFSKNYAFSSWCLDELVHIIECKEKYGQFVIPVFYHVDPSHVRKQKGSYAAAFDFLEEFFNDRMDKVEQWRNALSAAANLSGWDSQVTRPESTLVEVIVADITKKLNTISSLNDFKSLVGIDKRIEQIESKLQIGSLDVRIVGIWGMGGIGKTTLASLVFNRLASKFEGSCFLANVREEVDKCGLPHLRNKLFSTLLDEENLDMGNLYVGSIFLKRRLHRKRVLVVLDDVNDPDHLELLAGDRDWFGLGSRIIITSRDMQVLWNEVDEVYEVEKLNIEEALQLFHLNAFKGNPPKKDYTELSNRVVNYADGIPLAVKVLGSFLRHKRAENWERELNKLEEVPNNKIQNVLRISYDGLDRKEKSIFLDVACFFKGMNRDHVEKILEACGFFAKTGIDDLIDKSLITLGELNILWMHDLVQKMGWEIVQSVEELGKRTRLWIAQEVYHVLKNNKGTQTIEGIFLDTSEFSALDLGPAIFKETHNLRVLKIHNSDDITKSKVQLHQGLQFLPDALRYLYWNAYPLKSLPSNFTPRNLVELQMRNSQLKKLWDGVQHLTKLKRIDLSYSKFLTQISDLSQAPNLEFISLSHCTSLRHVPSLNFKNIESLTSLNSSYCEEFCCAQSGIYSRELGSASFDGCSSLKTLPRISGNIRSLDLSTSAIEEFPSSIWCLENLVSLDISNNKCLRKLPVNIFKLNSLHSLRLLGCSSLNKFPVLPRNIRKLNLSETTIEQVPSSIMNLCHLETFTLINCKKLNGLPTSICKLKSLTGLDLNGCSEFEAFPEILEPMESLRDLDLNYTAIKELPASIENLIGLCVINMGLCENLKILPNSIYKISHLENLFISNCPRLETLPAISVDLSHVSYLDLNYCNLVEIPDSLGCLSSLKNLDLRGNIIKEIPRSIKQLSKLTMLKITNCKNLRSLPELPLFLQMLCASGCTSLETLQNLSGNAFTQDCWDEYDGTYRKELLFYDSLKLDQNARNIIMTEFQLRALHIATTCKLKLGELNDSKSASICCKGNEIPKWFSYQSKGSLINVKLSPHCHNNNFLGFALCTVVEFGNYHSNCEYLNFYCTFHLKTSNGKSHEFCWTFPYWEDGELKRNSKHSSSEHVFMWYQHEDYHHCLDAVEASFDFFLRDELGILVDSSNCRVKRCGICLLHLQEGEEIDRIPNDQYVLGDPCVKGLIGPSQSATINSDMVEQGEENKPSRSGIARELEEWKQQTENAVIENDKGEEQIQSPSDTEQTEQLDELTRNILSLDINNVQSHILEEIVENIMNYFDNSNDGSSSTQSNYFSCS